MLPKGFLIWKGRQVKCKQFYDRPLNGIFTAVPVAASKQCSHGGYNDVDPKSTLGAFLGGKRISSGPVLWPGLIVMAAAREVFWSTPPRNLHSENTLANGRNWEIYLLIRSNMRHHARIR